MARLTKSDWRIIQKDYEAGVSQKTIREKYGMAASTLNSRIKRHGWQVTGKKPGTPKATEYQGRTIEVEQKPKSSYQPTSADRSKVQMLTIANFDSLEIAFLLDISHDDLLLHFQRELDTTKPTAEAQVAVALHRIAISKEGGSAAVQAAKTWLDRYGGQAESSKRPTKTCRDDIEDAQVVYTPLPPPTKNI